MPNWKTEVKQLCFRARSLGARLSDNFYLYPLQTARSVSFRCGS
jgi:hypothetical protein